MPASRLAIRTVKLGGGRGVRIEVDLHRHKRLLLGLYELELDRWLRRLCRSGYRSFDIGGQSGYDALVLAKQTGGAVLTFDRDPASCASMRRT